MSFFNLEVLKRKLTKSRCILTHVKLSKTYFLGQKKLKKIAIHMDLWKYGQISTIQKFLIINWLKFSNKRFIIWIYHHVLIYILSPNNKFGMWINISFFILWWSNQTTHIFQLQKSIITNKCVFLSINNNTLIFIMIFSV
jgi:hypothetical protein